LAVQFYLMASISLKLRNSTKGNPKIYLHFNYGRKKQLRYSTGYEVTSQSNWDALRQRVKNVTSEPRSQFINSQLSELVTFSERLLDDFERQNQVISNRIVKSKLDEFTKRKSVKNKKSLLEFYAWFIEYYSQNPLPKTKKPLSPNTVRPYKTALQKLKEFCNAYYKVDFQDITLGFYDDFLKHLQDKGYSNNYIGNQIKLLKAIMNYAYERDLHKNLEYKKKNFSKLSENVDAIYLTDKELAAIHDLNLKGSLHNRARDLFLIGAYTGLRVSDFNRLKPENIKKNNKGDKYIDITPRKTGKTVLIPIKRKLQEIFDKYDGKPPKGMSEQHINNALKEIAQLAKLNSTFTIEKTVGGKKLKTEYKKWELVTNHTARRSFCTNAYKAGLSTIDIMAISGHKSEAVFFKYIKITPSERLERLKQHPFFN